MSPVASSMLETQPSAEANKTAKHSYRISRVAVLGAGTMGARIAAHIANAGLPVLLLDMVPATGERSGLARAALETLKKTKPAAFASPAAMGLIRTGNFEDDLAAIESCDWVIEAVAENLEIKRTLLAKVAKHLHPGALLTTNTSGLPVARIAEQLSADVRRRWFGTHFFNPPRYMKLLEIIATPETDPAAIEVMSQFCDRQLGKTVVAAKDVQNFIANRIGTFSMLNTIKIMQEQGLTIEEIDSLTGQVIGFPKTGTFRLTDLVGVDVVGNVARNFLASASDERPDVVLPEMIAQLMERKWLGDKTKQGFYKKEIGADRKEVRLVLDPVSFTYKPAAEVALPALDQAKAVKTLDAKLKIVLGGDPAFDKAARFYWKMLPELWTYTANRIGEVADTPVDIDRAMTAGFNWEMGPFAMWDAAGLEFVVERMRAGGQPVPAAVEALLAAGGTSWYRANGAEYFDVASASYKPVASDPELRPISAYKQARGIFAGNRSVSLVDLGDGIGCFELHSKMNSLGVDSVEFLVEQLAADSDAVRNFDGFIVATDAPNFSVGANLAELVASAQAGRFEAIAATIRRFQDMTQSFKFCQRPVVAAPLGLCLGGGAEIAMHCAVRQPHLELAMGLVETGVGLIPGGGGCKEMLLRAIGAAAAVRPDARGESVELMEALKSVFETIAMAKVSTSAFEARAMRLLEEGDAISMNRARLVSDSKAQALRLARGGYATPMMRMDIPAPGANVFATLKLSAYMMHEAQFISEHDAKVATHVARILTGGDIVAGTLMSEQMVLDLEREAFLSLCGEPKTLERIAYTLQNGKPLRN
jgi:3-hydroxyacyl-CoA dehydrogenase